MNLLDNIVAFNQFQPATAVSLLVLMVLLLFCSAMVSGSETAMFALSRTQIDAIRKRNSPVDRTILKLMSIQDQLLATILIVNNLLNICIVIVADRAIDMMISFGNVGWEFAVKIVMVTFMLLLFGDIMPKIYAAYNPLRFSRAMAMPLMRLNGVMKPLSWLLMRSGIKLNDKVFRNKTGLSIHDLSNAVEITSNQTQEERRMLSEIAKFVNTEAGGIMKLRMDIVSVDITKDFADLKRLIVKTGFSRIPVYSETIDNIRGILYVKDMIPFVNAPDDFDWQKHLRKAYFVPEHKKINELFEEFRANRIHIAIVVDEYGATQGLISLEDIIEEIVGDITDESDAKDPGFYRKTDDGNYIFEGKTHLLDFEEVMGLGKDYFADLRNGNETLAGLLLEIKRDFLKKEESISAKGLKFTIVALDGRRIDKVHVMPDPKSPAQPDNQSTSETNKKA